MELDQIKTEYELKQFEGLCDRAKAFVFDWLLSDKDHTGIINAIYNGNILNNKFSPIEQIFNICYYRYIGSKFSQGENLHGVPIGIVFQEEFIAQEEIEIETKHINTECNAVEFATHRYIADFVIDFSRKNSNDKYLYPSIKKLKYIIELDGHEYHSDKKQVNNDYEREQDLQTAGYKVIRFTGSQVYNKPYSCIEKLITIIINDIKGVLQNGDL